MEYFAKRPPPQGLQGPQQLEVNDLVGPAHLTDPVANMFTAPVAGSTATDGTDTDGTTVAGVSNST